MALVELLSNRISYSAPGETENLVEALILGQGKSPGAGVQPLGRGLAVAAQSVPDGGGDRLGRPHAFGHQAEQPPACKAPEQFIVERDDRLVAAGSPWRPARPKSWRSMRRDS